MIQKEMNIINKLHQLVKINLNQTAIRLMEIKIIRLINTKPTGYEQDQKKPKQVKIKFKEEPKN